MFSPHQYYIITLLQISQVLSSLRFFSILHILKHKKIRRSKICQEVKLTNQIFIIISSLAGYYIICLELDAVIIILVVFRIILKINFEDK